MALQWKSELPGTTVSIGDLQEARNSRSGLAVLLAAQTSPNRTTAKLHDSFTPDGGVPGPPKR